MVTKRTINGNGCGLTWQYHYQLSVECLSLQRCVRGEILRDLQKEYMAIRVKGRHGEPLVTVVFSGCSFHPQSF